MKVLVAGASGALGRLVAEHLEREGHRVTATARRPDADNVLPLDLSDEAEVRRLASGHDAAILCPILTTSAPAARWLAQEGVGRIVLFSSNNVAIDEESEVYQGLRAAERGLERLRAETVILRPTMIYGHPADGNLSKLLSFARRFGFLPCPGNGKARQQPVHIQDVARAAVFALTAQGGVWTVSGPDVVSQRELFAEVLAAAGKRRDAVLTVPLDPLRRAARLAEGVRLPLPLSTAQLARMERDKVSQSHALPGFTVGTRLPEGLRGLATQLAADRGHV